jgi:spore maturation protein CgeB
VIAAPNALLETHFRPGRDMFRYRSEGDLADALADLVRDVDGMEAVAANGRERAMANFPPARLVEAMLNILESKDSLARQAAASVPA